MVNQINPAWVRALWSLLLEEKFRYQVENNKLLKDVYLRITKQNKEQQKHVSTSYKKKTTKTVYGKRNSKQQTKVAEYL